MQNAPLWEIKSADFINLKRKFIKKGIKRDTNINKVNTNIIVQHMYNRCEDLFFKKDAM